jgi:hypothetical protein
MVEKERARIALEEANERARIAKDEFLSIVRIDAIEGNLKKVYTAKVLRDALSLLGYTDVSRKRKQALCDLLTLHWNMESALHTGECSICYAEDVRLYRLVPCDHRVCYECVYRMQSKCCYCRGQIRSLQL